MDVAIEIISPKKGRADCCLGWYLKPSSLNLIKLFFCGSCLILISIVAAQNQMYETLGNL